MDIASAEDELAMRMGTKLDLVLALASTEGHKVAALGARSCGLDPSEIRKALIQMVGVLFVMALNGFMLWLSGTNLNKPCEKNVAAWLFILAIGGILNFALLQANERTKANHVDKGGLQCVASF